MHRAAFLLLLAGCPNKQPETPEQVPRYVAEEACESSLRAAPPVPPRPPADPYRLSPPAAMTFLTSDTFEPITFLCDLPDQILGLAATQTVDGGKRVVGGNVLVRPRTATARAIPNVVTIDATSPGCKQGELSCVFTTKSPAIAKLEMVREQWVNTSGWVHGMDDLCRALPDDTIAVCSTETRMAYIELGCGTELQLGIHDTTLPRLFDLDIEVPNARLRGAPDPKNGGNEWRYFFTGPKPFRTVALEISLSHAQAGGPDTERPSPPIGTLVIEGVREPCIAWALYRR